MSELVGRVFVWFCVLKWGSVTLIVSWLIICSHVCHFCCCLGSKLAVPQPSLGIRSNCCVPRRRWMRNKQRLDSSGVEGSTFVFGVKMGRNNHQSFKNLYGRWIITYVFQCMLDIFFFKKHGSVWRGMTLFFSSTCWVLWYFVSLINGELLWTLWAHNNQNSFCFNDLRSLWRDMAIAFWRPMPQWSWIFTLSW